MQGLKPLHNRKSALANLLIKGDIAMYAKPVAAAAVVPTVAAVTLPNTGGNLLVSAAVAVGAGMLAWGVLYAQSR